MIGSIARAISCRDISFRDIFDTRFNRKLIKVEIRMTNEICLKVLYSQFQNSKKIDIFVSHRSLEIFIQLFSEKASQHDIARTIDSNGGDE